MGTPDLADGTYPFARERLPLHELAFIEAPADLEALIRSEADRLDTAIVRDKPVELHCRLPDGYTLSFLVWWPTSPAQMHILAPRGFRRGLA